MNLDRCRAQRGRLRWDWWLLCPRGLTAWHLDRTAFGRRLCVELLCGWMDTDLNQGFLQLTNGLLQAVQPLVSDASNIVTCFSLVLNEDTVIRVGWVLIIVFLMISAELWGLSVFLFRASSREPCFPSWSKYLFSGLMEYYGQFQKWTKTPAGLVDIYFLVEHERRFNLWSYSRLWWDDQSLWGFTPTGLQQRKSLSLQALSRVEQPSPLAPHYL